MIHIVVDYSFLYYKYKFALDSGRMSRLSAPIERGGVMVEHDISQIYYSLREIEGFRKSAESSGEPVMVTVCFDMPSDRKAEDTAGAEKYKANRKHVLKDEDFENIQLVQKILDTAGYNTYKIPGYEADDVIYYLVSNTADMFTQTIIITPDADVLVNIRNNVCANRYKSGKGYTLVNVNNFSDVLGAEFKCTMPYNALMLYKVTVGDKSDCIDGIKGFGPKAFDKLVSYLNSLGITWEVCNSADNIKIVLDKLHESGYFDNSKYTEAMESLKLVRPKPFENGTVAMPNSMSDLKKREAAYLPYHMKSLIL